MSFREEVRAAATGRAGNAARRPCARAVPAPVTTLARMGRQTGLSLVELVVTLAVAGVLLAIAVPSYTHVMASNRLSTSANLFVASINSARLEAVRRNAPTQFCGSDSADNGADALGGACNGGMGGAGAVFALNNDGSTTRLQHAPDLPKGIDAASVAALRYSGQGLAQEVGASGPYSGLLADISTDDIASDNHRCLYVTTGSIVSSCVRTISSGACPSSEPHDCQQ